MLRFALIAPVVLILIVDATPASATPFFLSTYAEVVMSGTSGAGGSLDCVGNFFDQTGPISAGSGPACAQGYVGIPVVQPPLSGFTYVAHGASEATADYSKLGARATAYTSADGNPIGSGVNPGSGYVRAEALAKMFDTIDLGADLTGDFLKVTIFAFGDGGTVLVGDSNEISGFNQTQLTDANGNILAFDPLGSYYENVPIFGSTVSFGVGLLTYADCETAVFATTGCLANVDYSHTASIAGITVIDASGDIVNDPFVSASGTNYPTGSPAAVPEPTSLLLLGTGLVAGVRRWRKSH